LSTTTRISATLAIIPISPSSITDFHHTPTELYRY
jgi:hypothetical protein